MRYSLIIPVFNRPDEVSELLESLTRQSVKDFEVIIVEDGSIHKCKDVCEQYADILDLHYYDKPNSGYRDPSLASASEQLLTDLLTTNRYPFTDPVPADYEGEGAPIAKWFGTFPDLESSDIKHLRVPKALTELIKSTGHRYGIVVHAYGYIMSNELYDQKKLEELVGNIIRTVFDEPKHYTAGDQVGNALYTAVIDTQTDRVVYFNSVLSNADHPLSRRDVNNQMKSLLRKFN